MLVHQRVFIHYLLIYSCFSWTWGSWGLAGWQKSANSTHIFRVVPGKKITAVIHPPKAVRLRMQATEVLTQAVQSGCPLLRVWVDVCFRP